MNKMAATFYSFCVLFIISSLTLSYADTSCTPTEMAQENLKKLAIANNDLALNMLRQVTTGLSDNTFFSPMSLSTAFGMLYYGTSGKTAKELRTALGYESANLPEELVHQTFRYLLSDYLSSKDPSAYVLNSANAIMIDENLGLVPTYKTDVQNIYQASVEGVNFLKEAPQLVGKINSWVKEKTNGKIDKLLDELDPSTVMVLLNAIYFKGTWKTRFEQVKTRSRIFHNRGFEAKTVPMMRMTEKFPYADIGDLQAVELPYKGENISMIVLLPKERNGLENLVKSFTLEKLTAIYQKLYLNKIHLTIPKFKFEYSREMSDDFKALGIKDVFQPSADFTGLATDKNIFVSQVLHKAVIEVNEEGSEAAAITGIITNRMRPIINLTPKFVADHPFTFFIIDKRSGMILFLGQIVNL